jgi:hypothetical protein
LLFRRLAEVEERQLQGLRARELGTAPNPERVKRQRYKLHRFSGGPLRLTLCVSSTRPAHISADGGCLTRCASFRRLSFPTTSEVSRPHSSAHRNSRWRLIRGAVVGRKATTLAAMAGASSSTGGSRY